MNFTFPGRFLLLVFIALLQLNPAAVCFAQLPSANPAGPSLQPPTPVSATESEPNEFQAEPKKSAPNDELTAADSDKNKTDFIAAKSLSGLRPEFSVKPLRARDTDARPFLPRRHCSSGNDEWEFSFAPYLYLSALSGTVGARGRTFDIDMSIGGVLKKFDVGIMGVMEARTRK